MVESAGKAEGELVDSLADNVGVLSHIKHGRYRSMMAKPVVSSLMVF